MAVIIGLAVGLILAGLLMGWLAPHAGHPLLVIVVRYAGIALVVVGLILLITPVLVALNNWLRGALG